MKKRNFVLLLGETASALVFALGMCMCLLPEWNLFQTGIVVIAAGVIAMLIVFALYCKLSGKTTGSMIFGTGMCMTMVWSQYLMAAIVVGIVGIMMLLCLIPAVKGWR